MKISKEIWTKIKFNSGLRDLLRKWIYLKKNSGIYIVDFNPYPWAEGKNEKYLKQGGGEIIQLKGGREKMTFGQSFYPSLLNINSKYE